MLKVNIENFYYGKYKILENINLQAKTGDFIGIFGKSGSGKSTFLKIVGSIIQPQGQVLWQGKNIFNFSNSSLSEYRNQITGFDFQENNLIENINGLENIRLCETISGKKIDENWLEQVVEILEIKKILHKKIFNLSGGEVARISLAKSIVNKPHILISDEPGANLDEKLSFKVYDFLKSYSEKNIVLVSSHDKKLTPYLTQKYELQNYTFQTKI